MAKKFNYQITHNSINEEGFDASEIYGFCATLEIAKLCLKAIRAAVSNMDNIYEVGVIEEDNKGLFFTYTTDHGDESIFRLEVEEV